MRSKCNVLIYRNQLLPISETFVYNQSILLKRYSAYLLGAKLSLGQRIDLPNDRRCVVSGGGPSGRVKEAKFKLLGTVPDSVARWVRAVNPSLIHAHFGPDGAVISPLSRKLGLPLLVSFHGSDATLKDEYARRSYLNQRLFLLRRSSLRRHVTRVLVQSEYLKRIVIERQGFSEDKISLIRLGVEMNLFVPDVERTEWGNILYVGRIVPRKGLDSLIEAVARLRPRFPDVYLTVVGDGPNREEYESLARKRLSRGFEFMGAQPQDVVKRCLEKAYVFSMPSITMPSGEAETLGLVYVEAQAMKVPVVAFQSGGIPEVVLNGKTGLLAHEGDIDGLAKSLSTLLDDVKLQQQMGNAGREHVEKHFNLVIQNEKLENLYDEIVDGWHVGLEDAK